MKIIKTYESYNNLKDLDLGSFSFSGKIKKSKIIQNSDGTFDYDGDLDFDKINLKSLTEIPIRFRKVSGGFYCSSNQLTNLEGAPLEVGEGFYCDTNLLTSLQGAPSTVGGYFSCIQNKLTSLQYAPLEVGGDFWCSSNHLLSKACLSVIVGGYFHFDEEPFKITDEVIKTVKQMTLEQQMSELDFFGKYDKEAYEMLLNVLDSLGVDYSTHRKEMFSRVEDNKDLNTFF